MRRFSVPGFNHYLVSEINHENDAPNKPENNETNTPKASPDISNIAEELMLSLLACYQPVTEPGRDVELKSTIDIQEEMGSMGNIEKWEITTGLLNAGFKTLYNEAGFYWMLGKR